MPWSPYSLAALEELVDRDRSGCSETERHFFDSIRVEPEKWRLSPWGDEGGGFWVVAVHRDRALWFNDIEEGFNVSQYVTRGEIPSDEYCCNQDGLALALGKLQRGGADESCSADD